MIKACLQQFNFNKYQIIVVDNASTDNTLRIIRQHFPKVAIIQNSQNLGYSKANNIALRQIVTPFALLINVDAIIDEESIDQVLNVMEQNQQIAIAGPMVYGAEWLEGKIINPRLVSKINKKRKSYFESETCYFSQFITGAAMFFNMKIMKKIGFFDEGFFLYCEDNEICKRAEKKGYKVALIKSSKFYHLGGKSSSLSPQEIKRIAWHKFGWSKLYYTRKIWGVIPAKLKAIRMIAKFSLLCLKELLFQGTISVNNKAALKGCLCFLIGIKAFDKKGSPRG